MVEWKKRAYTGLIVTPLVFLITQSKLSFSILIHGNPCLMFSLKVNLAAVFLAWGEYRKIVQAIVKLHSSESEHQYINNLASSTVLTQLET